MWFSLFHCIVSEFDWICSSFSFLDNEFFEYIILINVSHLFSNVIFNQFLYCIDDIYTRDLMYLYAWKIFLFFAFCKKSLQHFCFVDRISWKYFNLLFLNFIKLLCVKKFLYAQRFLNIIFFKFVKLLFHHFFNFAHVCNFEMCNFVAFCNKFVAIFATWLRLSTLSSSNNNSFRVFCVTLNWFFK
jgi:hypothetical protein